MELEQLQNELIKALDDNNKDDIGHIYSEMGMYYSADNKSIDDMIKYYLMAIEYNNSLAMALLGHYYKEINDNNNMLKYYLMAIEQNNAHAMVLLGLYYKNINDIPNMLKYYLMAINNSDEFNNAMIDILKKSEYIDYNKIIEIVNIIKKKNIKDYNDNILEIIIKFSFEEQLNIKNILDIKTKKDIEIELKLKNFSKNTECIVCLEEKKCIPYSWCLHYLCTNCIGKCLKCLGCNKYPMCRYE